MKKFTDWCKENNKEYLFEEWDTEKNGEININTISYGSGQRVWWKQYYRDEKTGKEFVFSWDTQLRDRTTRDGGNPFLAGKRVLKGFNDIATTDPELVEEWHPTKNKYKPTELTIGSNKSIWWLKKYKDTFTGKEFVFEWESTLVNRTGGKGCPYTCNPPKLVYPGFNDLETKRPEVAKEWHPSRNGSLKPSEVTYKSNRKVWWLCENGHEWETAIGNRTEGKGCPYCSGKKIAIGENDFESWCLENNKEVLLMEWNDKALKPSEVTKHSKKKINWKCSVCKNEWKSVVSSRTKGIGCPECGRIKLSEALSIPKEDNDIISFCKKINDYTLVNEWDFKKNNKKPEQVNRGTNKKFFWICGKCNTSWETSPLSRISFKDDGLVSISSCPRCNKAYSSSYPEQIVYYYLKQCFPDTINGDKEILKGRELDIYIPSLAVAIEYDGEAWHKDISRDKEKNKLCVNKNIKLIRIREKGCQKMEANDNLIIFEIVPYDFIALKECIEKIISFLGCKIDVDIDRDQYDIRELINNDKKEKSIAYLSPNLINEWHPTKNGKLRPENFDNFSSTKVWWLCKTCGYEWKTSINVRTKAMCGCPACSRKVYAKGFNDLEVWSQKNNAEYILDEWDYSKNKLKPYDYSPASTEKVWWICPQCNNSYYSKINGRTSKARSGCLYCNGAAVLKGYNDFESWCKEHNHGLLEEWDYENNYILPSEVSFGSGEKVSWKCSKCGNQWMAKIDNRKKGRGCPICTNRKIVKGYNDFETWCNENNQQRLLNEWDYENNKILPSSVSKGSYTEVNWKCSKGHIYKCSIYLRVLGNICPLCKENTKILNVETGEMFDTIAEARRKYPKASKITDCVNGNRKTADGFHWKRIYIE